MTDVRGNASCLVSRFAPALRPNFYLLHIRDAIDRILTYPEERRDAFLGHPMIQDAALRNMEILGGAAKRVSGPVRDQAPEIPWPRWRGCATS